MIVQSLFDTFTDESSHVSDCHDHSHLPESQYGLSVCLLQAECLFKRQRPAYSILYLTSSIDTLLLRRNVICTVRQHLINILR